MADPVVPNFINGIGRLATDRFTYEKHIEGLNDRHKASQIDLFPTVVIGTTKTNVQDAIAAISLAVGTPPPDASTTVKGIVKLAGDIAGTATSVTVTKIQGKPISTSTPSAGDVLTWDGSVWKPQSITGTFANLTVTGNTTLGTSGSNTLLVNAQVTLSNNLSVNGNTNLGNGSSDVTTITGNLGVSGGTINLASSANATFSSVGSINISSGATGDISFASDAFISATNNLNLSASTSNFVATTLNLFGATIAMQSGPGKPVNIITLNPTSFTSLNGNTIVNSGTLSINPAAGLFIYPGASITTNANIVMAGTSKINKRYVTITSTFTNIYPGLYDVYLVSNSLSGDATYTIDDTTYPAQQTGIEFEVINRSSHLVYIYDPNSALIQGLSSFSRGVYYKSAGPWQFKYGTNIF